MPRKQSLEFAALRHAYRSGALTPTDLVEDVLERSASDPYHAWISRQSPATLRAFARELEGRDPESLPLYGLPFVIKDNIDLAGIPTTAGCPAFSYTPRRSATVVQRLIDAGAIPVGKANLDQFATGLNGTRSPFGPCRNAFDPEYIAGGSSSGSAVATALGQVSFALGTDTAGSGRVPAAFNNLVGLKPTCGLLSTSGVVPANRSLDTVAVLALHARDVEEVLRVAAAFDGGDPRSQRPVIARNRAPDRFTFGLPARSQAEFFGNVDYEARFAATVARLIELGGTLVEIDFAPFLEAGRLLYDGPWLAERHAAVGDFVRQRPADVLPVIREVLEKGRGTSAVDAFRGLYRLAGLRRAIEPVLLSVDVIVTPTVGTTHRIDAMQADPHRLNTQLGYFANFTNLLDLAAVAVPAGFTANGLPFGVTLFADAWSDWMLLDLATRLQDHADLPLGATGATATRELRDVAIPVGHVGIAVSGPYLQGLPLNRQLVERGAFLWKNARTAPAYRLLALPGGPPLRGGLLKVEQGGVSIGVEIWAMPLPAYGSFVAGLTRPLAIGAVELADKAHVQGLLCESHAATGARDISDFGGWRAYLTGIAP